MNDHPRTVLMFPSGSNAMSRRALLKGLLKALRSSESPIILDLEQCHTLDREDVDLLLDCVDQSVGHDTQLVFVAVSAGIRALLDVIRVSALVPVLSSMEEALSYPRRTPEGMFSDIATSHPQLAWSA
jgi:hypothetical protein